MIQTPNFDSIKQINPYGIEYWSARDLMPLLGYKKWQKFEEANEAPRRKQRGIYQPPLPPFAPQAAGNWTRRD